MNMWFGKRIFSLESQHFVGEQKKNYYKITNHRLIYFLSH